MPNRAEIFLSVPSVHRSSRTIDTHVSCITFHVPHCNIGRYGDYTIATSDRIRSSSIRDDG